MAVSAGVHHVAVGTPDFQRVVREQAERGTEPILRGTFSGIECQYLDTERDLGMILEICNDMSGKQADYSIGR